MSEQDRHRLLQRLREILGDEEAATLMENLPPLPWSELATKADLEGLATKADLEQLPTKADLEQLPTKADLEQLPTKADLEQLPTKADLEGLPTKADLEVLRDDVTELDVKLRTLDGSLDLRFERSEARMESLVHRTVTAQTRVLLVGLLGSVLTAAAIAFGAAAV